MERKCAVFVFAISAASLISGELAASEISPGNARVASAGDSAGNNSDLRQRKAPQPGASSRGRASVRIIRPVSIEWNGLELKIHDRRNYTYYVTPDGARVIVLE